jgi:hypothetical protein
MSSGHQAEASLLATFSQPRCMPSSMSSCLEIFSGLSSWLQGVGKTLSSLIPPLHRKHLPGWGDLPLPWPPSASWVLAILTHCGQRSVLGGKADKCPRAGSAHQLGPPWHHGNQNAPVHVVSQDGIERSRRGPDSVTPGPQLSHLHTIPGPDWASRTSQSPTSFGPCCMHDYPLLT